MHVSHLIFYGTASIIHDIAAAACGDTFLPAGFTEFAGWSDSAAKEEEGRDGDRCPTYDAVAMSEIG